MAKSLKLEEDSFSKQFGDRVLMQTRFNFYPPCSKPDQVLGVKPHTDRSGITVLLQDAEVEGLQVFIADRWVRVPIIPDALLVNLGDQMQVNFFQMFIQYANYYHDFLFIFYIEPQKLSTYEASPINCMIPIIICLETRIIPINIIQAKAFDQMAGCMNCCR